MKELIYKRKEAMEQRRIHRQKAPVSWSAYYLEGYANHLEAPPLLREAHGFYSLFSQIPLELYPDEWIAGGIFVKEVAGFHYGSGTWLNWEGIHAYAAQKDLDGTVLQNFLDKAKSMERLRYKGGNPSIFTEEENRSIQSYAAASTWFGGHMVLDYERILSIGLDGYAFSIEQAEKSGTGDFYFYAGLRTMLNAIQIYIERYASLARQCAEQPEYDKSKSLALADTLKHIAHYPPQNFYQGLQLVYILHLLNGADSFGRFDNYLLPLFQKDLDTGVINEEQAYQLILDFWVKIEEADAIQNMTIGGVDAQGNLQYSLLTEMCIRATREVGYKGPNLCLRVNSDMPESVWKEAMACLGKGLGLPALYNDSDYIRMLERAGYPTEVARNYCLAGCSQVMLPGMCNFVNDIGIYNIAKVMELTLYNGVDPLTGQQVGLQTGALEDMCSFDQLMEAFERQNRYFVDLEIDLNNRDIAYRAETEGYAMRTLFMRDCISQGRPVFKGGARYNNVELEILGLTNACDSLYAVKRAVFDEKKYTARELLELLQQNFEGHESDRLYLRNRIDKFGNDVEECDALRARISKDTYQMFNQASTVLGGIFVPGEVIFVTHEPAGQALGATPDGRKAHTVLADSMGAAQGMDMKGPTALLRSVVQVPARDYLLTTPVLNLRFASSLWENKTSQLKIRTLFQEFFSLGGMQLQINVCNANVLRAAVREPENYRSLIVRVGGYSDYFVNLSPILQQEILSRTEQVV